MSHLRLASRRFLGQRLLPEVAHQLPLVRIKHARLQISATNFKTNEEHPVATHPGGVCGIATTIHASTIPPRAVRAYALWAHLENLQRPWRLLMLCSVQYEYMLYQWYALSPLLYVRLGGVL